MARWAWLTMLLYGGALAALAGPLLLTIPDVKPGDLIREAYHPEAWGFGGVIGFFMILEGCALFVPVRMSRGRPMRRGPWTLLAVVSGLLMGLLMMAGVLSLAEGIWKDKVGDETALIAVSCAVGGWIFWGIVFSRLRRVRDRHILDRVVRTLVAGSIAELLVAVPCHILVRKKEYCCAGHLTFLGLTTGFAVLLFAFGPATYFLFVDRLRRLQPKD